MSDLEKNCTAYLCVDHYLQGFMQVQMLKGAFECGVVDALLGGVNSVGELKNRTKTDAEGLMFLLGALEKNGVVGVSSCGQKVGLNADFVFALNYRDLMEAKIYFSNLVAPDLVQNTVSFLSDAEGFMQQSQLFELFDYHRALESTPDNYRFTERWMKLTTALTRYEAAACLQYHDFSGYRSMIDVGGNSGEFVLQLTRRNPGLRALVVDLPVVCEVGERHVSDYSESGRIGFIPADALYDSLPMGQCLVSFKSMLHDWPEDAVTRFFEQAWVSLKEGGELVIYERAPIDLSEGGAGLDCLGYGSLSTVMFFRSYRSASTYRELLVLAGFVDVNVQSIELEVPFHLITARKAAR